MGAAGTIRAQRLEHYEQRKPDRVGQQCFISGVDPGRAAGVRAARHVRGAVRRDRPDGRALPNRDTPTREPRPATGPGSGPSPHPPLTFLAATECTSTRRRRSTPTWRSTPMAVRVARRLERLRAATAVAPQALTFSQPGRRVQPAAPDVASISTSARGSPSPPGARRGPSRRSRSRCAPTRSRQHRDRMPSVPNALDPW